LDLRPSGDASVNFEGEGIGNNDGEEGGVVDCVAWIRKPIFWNPEVAGGATLAGKGTAFDGTSADDASEHVWGQEVDFTVGSEVFFLWDLVGITLSRFTC
jgi:hypothetical protein